MGSVFFFWGRIESGRTTMKLHWCVCSSARLLVCSDVRLLVCSSARLSGCSLSLAPCGVPLSFCVYGVCVFNAMVLGSDSFRVFSASEFLGFTHQPEYAPRLSETIIY